VGTLLPEGLISDGIGDHVAGYISKPWRVLAALKERNANSNLGTGATLTMLKCPDELHENGSGQPAMNSTEAGKAIKAILVLLLGLTLVSVHLAEAQQQTKVPKIGWLGIGGLGTGRELLGRELRELGYVGGKKIAIEDRSANNRIDRLPALADELVRLKVDVLVAPSAIAALAAKNATRTIPIIFYTVSDPVAAGLVDSLARPGGNITGITNIAAVLSGKRLELLKETIPKLSSIAVLWDPQISGMNAQQWKESQVPARELGLELHSMEVSSADNYEGAFKEAIKARSAALAVISSPLVSSNRKRIADLAEKNRLPAIYSRGDYVESAGLMSYGAELAEPPRRVASMVDKILKGAKPADLPVEQPTKFEFIINLKAAKQIGLTIPPNVLARADKVIR
jgi:putative tryptophan/tyrosine transport system substrate-binding protein